MRSSMNTAGWVRLGALAAAASRKEKAKAAATTPAGERTRDRRGQWAKPPEPWPGSARVSVVIERLSPYDSRPDHQVVRRAFPGASGRPTGDQQDRDAERQISCAQHWA